MLINYRAITCPVSPEKKGVVTSRDILAILLFLCIVMMTFVTAAILHFEINF